MKEPSVAQRQRIAILLALADIDRPYGLSVAQIASTTPWPAAALYTPLYSLERAGLVFIDRWHSEGMIILLAEPPDLAAIHLDDVTVPDDREDQ